MFSRLLHHAGLRARAPRGGGEGMLWWCQALPGAQSGLGVLRRCLGEHCHPCRRSRGALTRRCPLRGCRFASPSWTMPRWPGWRHSPACPSSCCWRAASSAWAPWTHQQVGAPHACSSACLRAACAAALASAFAHPAPAHRDLAPAHRFSNHNPVPFPCRRPGHQCPAYQPAGSTHPGSRQQQQQQPRRRHQPGRPGGPGRQPRCTGPRAPGPMQHLCRLRLWQPGQAAAAALPAGAAAHILLRHAVPPAW